MLRHLVITEIKSSVTIRNVLVWSLLILIPFIIRFLTIKQGYVFYESSEVFEEIISGFIPMLFPILLLAIYITSFVNEQKNNYLIYTKTRVWTPTYIVSKGIVNGILCFIIAFLMIFVPFIFAIYIEPLLGIVQFYPSGQNSLSSSTFNFLSNSGLLSYGIGYSLWVAINGVTYATLTFILTLIINNSFVALSLPFISYQIMNFITGILGYSKFSPISTIFPFNIMSQEVWTTLIPFSIIWIIILSLIMYIWVTKRELTN